MISFQHLACVCKCVYVTVVSLWSGLNYTTLASIKVHQPTSQGWAPKTQLQPPITPLSPILFVSPSWKRWKNSPPKLIFYHPQPLGGKNSVWLINWRRCKREKKKDKSPQVWKSYDTVKKWSCLLTLSWMQAEALKWQPVTTKASRMAFASLFQLSFSPWSSPKHLNPSFHACISVSVRQVQNKPKLLGLNQAIYTWKLAWQLNGNICSAKQRAQ